MSWTPEELEAIQEADRQIEAEFAITPEERNAAAALDESHMTEKQRKRRARNQRYWARHKDVCTAATKRWVKNHPEQAKEIQRRWRQKVKNEKEIKNEG